MRHSGGFTQTKKKNQAKGAFLYLILLAFVLIDYHKVFFVSIPFCRVPAILCLVLLPFFLVAGSPCILFQLLLLSWFSRNNCCRRLARMICFSLSLMLYRFNSFFASLLPNRVCTLSPAIIASFISFSSVRSLAGVPAAIFITVCSLSYLLAITAARLPSLLLMCRVGLEPTPARL